MNASDSNGHDAGSRGASIRDVARAADVSYQTVSRVLNGHPSVRDATKQRVLAAMEELQYRPNRAARALATSRSRMIGVLAAANSSYFGPSRSISSIEDAARAAGYSVLIANVDGDDPESIRDGLDHLGAHAIEGLVVVAPQTSVLDAISGLRMRVPMVTLESTGQYDDHAISVDQVAGARIATRHLIELGHRRILHLAGPQNWIDANARARGFADEMREHGLSPVESLVGDWSAESGFSAGAHLVHSLPAGDATAVFAGNDQMALGLIHALHDADIDVPGEVSVIGFDDLPEAAHFWPPLTTIRQDFAELGRRSMEVLLRELGGNGPAGAHPDAMTIAPVLVARASTAPPARPGD